MQNILIERGEDNFGGIQTIYYAWWRDVESWPGTVGNTLEGDIVLKAGKVWYELEYVLETARFDEEASEGQHGATKRLGLSGFIPKDDASKAYALQNLEGGEFIVAFLDNNGKLKVAGNEDIALNFNYQFGSQDQLSRRNGYLFNFEGNSHLKSYFYNGDITTIAGPITPPAGSPILIGETGGFAVISEDDGATEAFKISQTTPSTVEGLVLFGYKSLPAGIRNVQVDLNSESFNNQLPIVKVGQLTMDKISISELKSTDPNKVFGTDNEGNPVLLDLTAIAADSGGRITP